MKYASLYLQYTDMSPIRNLPLGKPENQEDFNQLQTELESISNLIRDFNLCLNSDNQTLPKEYIFRCFSINLTKLDEDFWQIDPTDVMPKRPTNYTPKQIDRIVDRCNDICKYSKELLTNPNLIDYVGRDEQLDWASIGYLLKAGIKLINHVGADYGHHQLCA